MTKIDISLNVLKNALNELKRLKKFKETFDNYELAKKQDFIAYENWIECEAELKKSIIELEDLRESNKEMRKLLDEVYAKMPHTNDCKRG